MGYFRWLLPLLCAAGGLFPASGAIASNQTDDGSIRVEALLSESSPYVQQTLVYTLRVISTLPIRNVDAQLPLIQGIAPLELLDEQPLSHYRDYKGRRYHITDLRYALTPMTLGEIRIPASRLTLRYEATQQWSYGYYNSPRNLQEASLETEPLSLTIRPPASAQQPWLPLYGLNIQGHLEEPEEKKVGEPLTLTLTLSAVGMDGSQLPILEFPDSKDFKVYPERAQTSRRVAENGNALLGWRVQTYTLIPQRSGRLNLPGLRVTWWNLKDKREDISEWPTQVIEVGSGGAADAESETAGVADFAPARGGLPWLWLLPYSLLLFGFGWWLGAGRPGWEWVLDQWEDHIQPLTVKWRAQWAEIYADLPWRRAAETRTEAEPAAPLPVQPKIEPAYLRHLGGHWLPVPLKNLRLLQCVDNAESAREVSTWLQVYAYYVLELPAYSALPTIARRVAAAYPQLEPETVDDLLHQLDKACYAKQAQIDLHHWKSDFRHTFQVLAFRRPRMDKTARQGLPVLNPFPVESSIHP